MAGGRFSWATILSRSREKTWVTIAPRSAMPNTPPISRLALVVAEAMPALCGGTVLMTAAVIGLMTMAMPKPARLSSGQMCRTVCDLYLGEQEEAHRI